MNRKSTSAALFVLSLLLAGCGGSAPKTPGSVAPPPAGGAYQWAGRAEVGKAIALLNNGKTKNARKILTDLLKRHPDDAIAARLVKQIDTDPKLMLGTRSFAYVTRAQDSFTSLAQRFLGDATLFYALARYNGVAVPSRLVPGTALRIPGEEKPEAPPPPRVAPAPRPVPPVAKPAPEAARTPPPVRPAAPAANPARAVQLRAAGLEQMNRGAIARAVGLLQQASRLDPGNALIRRDLDRAIRIRRTVETSR